MFICSEETVKCWEEFTLRKVLGNVICWSSRFLITHCTISFSALWKCNNVKDLKHKAFTFFLFVEPACVAMTLHVYFRLACPSEGDNCPAEQEIPCPVIELGDFTIYLVHKSWPLGPLLSKFIIPIHSLTLLFLRPIFLIIRSRCT